jgi:hypothetical protein
MFRIESGGWPNLIGTAGSMRSERRLTLAPLLTTPCHLLFAVVSWCSRQWRTDAQGKSFVAVNRRISRR